MGLRKHGTVLADNHAAAVVNPPFRKRIPGVKLILRFDVYDQPDLLTGYRYPSVKADISYLWFLFNVLFCNFIDGTVCIFRKAAFHDPGKDDLLCQKTFAGFF